MIKVNREEFLSKLQSVQPGLTAKDTVQQSSCLVFQGGYITTFNGQETMCRVPSGFEDEFTCAVNGKHVMDILTEADEDEVELKLTQTHFVIVENSNARSRVKMEAEILLPTAVVEMPTEWLPLAPEFAEAVEMASMCVDKKSMRFGVTCIHLTANFVEAMDNYQALRFAVDTNLEQECLIKGESLSGIVPMGMTEVAETAAWVHFRNPAGLVYSCRRYLEKYLDITDHLAVTGEPVTLPGGLPEALKKANIFSSDNADEGCVKIDLATNAMRITGYNDRGDRQEIKNVKYQGRPFTFLIPPKLLLQIAKRQKECELAEDRLKVDGGKFQYIAMLADPNKKNKKKEENQE